MCTISVAYDEAFSFYYQDNFDALREARAELLFFSPIHDEVMPKCDGLYLGGGYPELYGRELSENVSMRESIRSAVTSHLPTIAECGGFMYLQQRIRMPDENDQVYELAGVFPGEVYQTPRARRFGYLTIEASADSMLFKAGERVPVHEYHHWDCTDCGDALTASKVNGKSWRFGFVSDFLYAGFPHLHFGGETPLAKRFVEAMSS
ncbi:MAG: hypothetical protein K6B14_05640 [Lachnospiraceae bacterium]|nr:hypothetical protein [Lachnospiraceae bacterium]